MANWTKNYCVIQLAAVTTLSDDTATHTVKVQPIDQAYSNGAVLCTAGTGNASRYTPNSDLDTTKVYDVYVDDTKVGRIFGPDTVTQPAF